MIRFLTTWAHRYTHRNLKHYAGMPPYRMCSYRRLFRARTLPAGTWIFTDLDRLSFWELELAARIYRELRQAGMRVLNNPATVRQRYHLLKDLRALDFNRFAVWHATEAERPGRFPVFLRTISAHRGVLTDLLHDQAAVDHAIRGAVEEGHPLADLMIVEYYARPIVEGIFAKFAAFRCGDRIVEAVAAHQRHWCAKLGELGVAPEAVYEGELKRVRETPHAAELMKAFEIAHIEYGRADYTVIDGQVQIYEINTNPMIPRMRSHPYPSRLQSDAVWREGMVAAMKAIDDKGGNGRVRLKDPMLRQHRWERLNRFGAWWMP